MFVLYYLYKVMPCVLKQAQTLSDTNGRQNKYPRYILNSKCSQLEIYNGKLIKCYQQTTQ